MNNSQESYQRKVYRQLQSALTWSVGLTVLPHQLFLSFERRRQFVESQGQLPLEGRSLAELLEERVLALEHRLSRVRSLHGKRILHRFQRHRLCRETSK